MQLPWKLRTLYVVSATIKTHIRALLNPHYTIQPSLYSLYSWYLGLSVQLYFAAMAKKLQGKVWVYVGPSVTCMLD